MTDLGSHQPWNQGNRGPHTWACPEMLVSGGGEGLSQQFPLLSVLGPFWVVVGQRSGLQQTGHWEVGLALHVDPGAVLIVSGRRWAQEELRMGSCCESGR